MFRLTSTKALVTQILYLAESSLPKSQFHAFRKLALDYLAQFEKHGRESDSAFGQDRCGSTQIKGKGGGVMTG